FVADPEAGVRRRAARLESWEKMYESMAVHAETAEQRRAAAEALNATKRDIEAMRIEDRRQARADRLAVAGGREHFQRAGATPSGETVSYDPATGRNLIAGDQGMTEYRGPLMSQQALDKQAASVQEALAGASRAQSLLDRVKQNP